MSSAITDKPPRHIIPNPVFRVPPIQGFRHHLYTNIREYAGCGPLGLHVSKLSHGKENLSVIAAVAETPANSEAYLRALIIRHHDDADGKSIDIDLALDGDGLSPTSNQGLGLVPGRNTRSPDDIRRITQSTKLLEKLIWGLRVNGILKEGCLIHRRKLLVGFQEGLIDLLVQESLDDIPIANTVCDPNSVSRVSDLDFEIGTGILGEPELGSNDPVNGLVHKARAIYEPATASCGTKMNEILGYLINQGLIKREGPTMFPPEDGQLHVSQMLSRLSGHAFYGFDHNFVDPTIAAADICDFPVLFRCGYHDWIHPSRHRKTQYFASQGVISVTTDSYRAIDPGDTVKPRHELDFIEYDTVISLEPFDHDWFLHEPV